MAFYVVKSIFPIAIPRYKWNGNPYRIKENDYIIALQDRINLLDRDHLVYATKAYNALQVFLSCSKDPYTQNPTLFGVPCETGNSHHIPLILNIWYAAEIISNRKKYVFCFMPSIISGPASFVDFEHLSTDTKRLIGKLQQQTYESPLTFLIKQTKEPSAEFIKEAIAYQKIANTNIENKIYHVIKSIKEEWILVETNTGDRVLN